MASSIVQKTFFLGGQRSRLESSSRSFKGSNFAENKACFRRNVSVASVASAESAEVSVEERKKQLDKYMDENSFKIIEVDATSPFEFNAATVLDTKEIAPGVKLITFEAEISREFVNLVDSYTNPGQLAQVRLPSGTVYSAPVSSPPFPTLNNHSVLLKARGDIPSGSSKLAQYGLSVKSPLQLHVAEAALPELYALEKGSTVEFGPFSKPANFRPILFIARFVTVLIFASGDGIAAARALINAKDTGSLYLNMRQEVRLFYSAADPDSLLYKDEWAEWESRNIKVRSTTGSVQELFDEDDLEYDPDTTSAVVFGNKAENDKVAKLLELAEIPEKSIVRVDF